MCLNIEKRSVGLHMHTYGEEKFNLLLAAKCNTPIKIHPKFIEVWCDYAL
jgi:hypothetical protein